MSGHASRAGHKWPFKVQESAAGVTIGTAEVTGSATCVGCGCTDNRACVGGCSWLAVSRSDGTGVCSNCGGHLDAWRAAHG